MDKLENNKANFMAINWTDKENVEIKVIESTAGLAWTKERRQKLTTTKPLNEGDEIVYSCCSKISIL